MDLRLPDTNGIDATIALRAHFPGARIIILTMFDCDGEIQRALAAGAQSYVLKTMPPQEIAEVIRRFHAGRKFIPPEVAAHLAEHLGDEPFTDRELAVLRLVMAGNCNRIIAACLFISAETVKAHVKHVFEKLDAAHFWWVPDVNAATYAVIGLIAEILHRKSNHTSQFNLKAACPLPGQFRAVGVSS